MRRHIISPGRLHLLPAVTILVSSGIWGRNRSAIRHYWRMTIDLPDGPLSPPTAPPGVAVEQPADDRHELEVVHHVMDTAFLDDTPRPDETQIREALSGNLCRCTGYQHIVEAVALAAQRLRS